MQRAKFILVASALFSTVFALPPHLYAGEPAADRWLDPAGLENRIHAQLQSLERDLRDLLLRVERTAAVGRAPEPGLRGEAETFSTHLHMLEVRIRGSRSPQTDALLAQLRSLKLLVKELELAAARVSPKADGAIAGTVTDAATSDPLQAIDVEIFDASGSLAASGSTDAMGSYTVGGFAVGTYFATTSNNAGFLDELYDDLPCPGGGSGDCDPTTGTPIAVSDGTTSAGIDFALERLGAISGTVTSAATGDPIAFVTVEIFDAGGSLVANGLTDALGNYTAGGLLAGIYFATTRSISELLDELYDELPCIFGSCDPTTGTPIAVALGATTAGIDFALDLAGAISGTVTSEATGGPIPANIEVDVWDAGGSLVGAAFTDSAGGYTVGGLAPGTYFASTLNFADLLDELYDDLPCPGGGFAGCDPRTGTPIAVSIGSTTGGIDFALGGVDSDACVSGDEILCLLGRRFQVEVLWVTADGTGMGQAVTLTGAAGYFWFFSPENIELVVKVLDACTLEGFNTFWVFAAGLTDVEVTLKVTDTETDQVREYSSPLGEAFQPITDTAAFATCP